MKLDIRTSTESALHIAGFGHTIQNYC